MKYEDKYKNDKIKFTLLICGIVVVVVVVLVVLLAPSMIETPDPDPTQAPMTTAEAPGGDFEIEDEALKSAIQEALNIDEITEQDMERLEVLDCGERVIRSFEGLQFAVNLRELTAKVDVTTLEPLKNMAIRKLTLSCDYSVQLLMQDISQIQSLQVLDLTDCGVTSVGYLTELPHLTELVLDDNKIHYLNYFNSMPFLERLSLRGCSITSIEDMSGNSTLVYVDLRDNEITDLSVLDSFLSLEEALTEGNPEQTPSEELE